MLGSTRKNKRPATLGDVGLLALRLTAGGLLAAHGAQKLFGVLGGHGVKATASWLESFGLRPGPAWSVLAGLSEFAGGTLMAFGLLDPIGELGVIGAMGMATVTAHRGKPLWATSGGAELPVTNLAIASALILTGPGSLSFDRAFGIEVPRWVSLPGLAVVGTGIAIGIRSSLPIGPKVMKGAQLAIPEAARLA